MLNTGFIDKAYADWIILIRIEQMNSENTVTSLRNFTMLVVSEGCRYCNTLSPTLIIRSVKEKEHETIVLVNQTLSHSHFVQFT